MNKRKYILFVIPANQGLLHETAQNHSFERDDGTRVTIQQHYAETYNLNLRFPGLPWLV
jgi:hypothetical protein